MKVLFFYFVSFFFIRHCEDPKKGPHSKKIPTLGIELEGNEHDSKAIQTIKEALGSPPKEGPHSKMMTTD